MYALVGFALEKFPITTPPRCNEPQEFLQEYPEGPIIQVVEQPRGTRRNHIGDPGEI
jgi:hypothetical protein